MNVQIARSWSKNGFGVYLIVLLCAAILLFLASCSSSGSDRSEVSDEGTPDDPPELSVVINSIDLDECPTVKVFLSVADENLQLIQDDLALSVNLFEDGIEQTNNFILEWKDDLQAPITIVFAMDYSLSMSDTSIADMEAGVKAFVDAMGPGDQAAIIKFFYEPQVMTGLTSDKAALYNAVDQPPDSRDYTNIYDTVFEAANIAAGGGGQLAIILLTDGEHVVIPSYPVYHTMEEAIDNAKQQQVPVFSIALGLRDDSDIKYISQETGGIFYPILDSSVISEIYMSLFDLLDSQYMISYTSAAADGLQHSIQLSAEYNGVTGESIIRNFFLCPAP